MYGIYLKNQVKYYTGISENKIDRCNTQGGCELPQSILTGLILEEFIKVTPMFQRLGSNNIE